MDRAGNVDCTHWECKFRIKLPSAHTDAIPTETFAIQVSSWYRPIDSVIPSRLWASRFERLSCVNPPALPGDS